jgi:acetyl-CoA/propionyl-CoA carboxylase, biotin carboxylase, biotin carboxyl carrier protein
VPAFGTVLIANRGEIAVRITRTLHRMGMRAAVVYSDPDAGARHVRDADVAVRVGPGEAARSYLDAEAVLAAASAVGAEAVHPGYGFLSENAEFARRCAATGIVFVGPSPDVIELMGDKIRAKQAVEAAGVPVVPGVHRPGMSDSDLADAAQRIGYPILLKPSAGGGGKGMRLVATPAEISAAAASARREALGAFGDGTLFVERFVRSPRHIEVQILADARGTTLHLGERECSLQRRMQKVVEEAPSALLSTEQRSAIGSAAVRVARECGYTGAGTVEFVVAGDQPDSFYFLEMNTRLQVEHPVTEMVTGLDLVEEQIRVAAGEPLRWTQDRIVVSGHAIEARVYAEDPARGFLPTGGQVLVATESSVPGSRTDSGVASGSVVGTDYDPMLAKVVGWGPDRSTAMDTLQAALRGTTILGVRTNGAFLQALLDDADVRTGRLDTGLIERNLDHLVVAKPPGDLGAVAGLARLADRASPARSGPVPDLFDTLVGWRLDGAGWVRNDFDLDRGTVGATADAGPTKVYTRGDARGADVRTGDGPVIRGSASLDGTRLDVVLDGVRSSWLYARDADGAWLGRDGVSWQVRDAAPSSDRSRGGHRSAGPLTSPMPGTVTAVHASTGDRVGAGQPIVSVEAMKMEHVVSAPVEGVLSELPVRVGQVVPLDAVLAVIEPDPGEPA